MAVRVTTLCFLVFLSIPASADSLTGKVVKITDGDTLYESYPGWAWRRLDTFLRRVSNILRLT